MLILTSISILKEWRYLWSDDPIWHSFFISVVDGTFVVSALRCWCLLRFRDLNWYHCCPEFGDVCASCDLKFLSSNELYECGYCIMRLYRCHSGGVIWILTLYSSLAIHRAQVCDRCWVSFGLHESITHLLVLCSLCLV
jgi:hypothetical protein